ncbi:biliverdin-producing heme oxygenase [Aggregicoccus sp. 17bor-14]|uniref:biliverdin-producing heme oxygenase n=1 Tax=Myxococcaceae TaxID=31 RepID=UPI00129CD1A3|nr:MULTISPECIES: biliverdin-producing heme oxygenase [Myxococcaceae]MBF5046643.1 biliverdin-producing heme oxygenase [Simulacricoccus sp. 17bor-14]MRI92353.1 biliverdin-producing heme oxygenase [Aggregicoccus sp. 17bor-14]
MSLPPVPGAAPRTILQRLKEETREHHARAEAAMRLLDPALSPALYRRHLEALYGLYAPLEGQLEGLLSGAQGAEALELPRRWKRTFLARDLTALGHDAQSLERLPRAPPLPLEGVPEALGAMYVLEGATLGGQLLLRHLTRHFSGQYSGHPVGDFTFFRAYEEALGPMWRAFGEALVRATPDEPFAQRVVRGAHLTFDAFERWLDEALRAPPAGSPGA